MNKKSYEAFKKIYGTTLLSLSKEELIKMIAIYRSCCIKIGETCVNESKLEIRPEKAINRIRHYLNEVDFVFYDEELLKKDLKDLIE